MRALSFILLKSLPHLIEGFSGVLLKRGYLVPQSCGLGLGVEVVQECRPSISPCRQRSGTGIPNFTKINHHILPLLIMVLNQLNSFFSYIICNKHLESFFPYLFLLLLLFRLSSKSQTEEGDITILYRQILELLPLWFFFSSLYGSYHKCLKGRENAMKMLRNMVQERRKKPRKNPSDLFDYVIEEIQKDGTILAEEIPLNLMFVFLFASFERTSLALTLAIKFLSDDPAVIQRLTEEHETILRNREDADSGLTWEEYRSMTYAFQALIDLKYKDYTIPAGRAVMVCPPTVHLNPDKYEDPLVFNPSRWEVR
uniref:Cytochrome P450 87A2-4 n=1 Tax=Isatis tinctoria TaxID=161756 RepID=A0A8F0FSW3_ISATI|nr:cytochrome P450 87A2-4 [Isatis tinctoria]